MASLFRTMRPVFRRTAGVRFASGSSKTAAPRAQAINGSRWMMAATGVATVGLGVAACDDGGDTVFSLLGDIRDRLTALEAKVGAGGGGGGGGGTPRGVRRAAEGAFSSAIVVNGLKVRARYASVT